MAGRGGPPEPTDAQVLALRFRAKDALRRRIRAVRGALPAEARARRSSIIADRVMALHAWTDASTVAVYVAMRGEVDPEPLVARAWSDGKTVVLPRVDWEAGTMTLHRWDPGAELADSGRGFMEAPAEAPTVPASEVDLVLVPALAADPRGHRIGWGRGFYDRLLPTTPRARRLALVYDFQIVAEVPDTPGDEAVHMVITDGPVFSAPG